MRRMEWELMLTNLVDDPEADKPDMLALVVGVGGELARIAAALEAIASTPTGAVD